MDRFLRKAAPGAWRRWVILSVPLFLLAIGLRAQQLTVSGVVRSGGAALPGVSIIEKGTSNGTTSDSDGRFSLSVGSADPILVFSFIGYSTQEVNVGNRAQLDVSMVEEVTALNEVVVTALGVEREVKSLGYAVQTVDGDVMTKAREPNVINSLTGRVAGLQIKNQTDLFQDPDISLRGAKPLIV